MKNMKLTFIYFNLIIVTVIWLGLFNLNEAHGMYSAGSSLPVVPPPAPAPVPIPIPAPVPMVQEILQPIIVPFRRVPIRPPKYNYKKYDNYQSGYSDKYKKYNKYQTGYSDKYKKRYKNDYDQDKYSRIKERYRNRMIEEDENDQDEIGEDYYANDSNQLNNIVKYLDKYYEKNSKNYDKNYDDKYKRKNGKTYSNKKSKSNGSKYKTNEKYKDKASKLSSILQPDYYEYNDFNYEYNQEYEY